MLEIVNSPFQFWKSQNGQKYSKLIFHDFPMTFLVFFYFP